MTIRAALASDSDAIWAILEPVIRGGETFALPRDMRREKALSYWFAPTHEVFVALEGTKQSGPTSFVPITLGAAPMWPTPVTSLRANRLGKESPDPCACTLSIALAASDFEPCSSILW